MPPIPDLSVWQVPAAKPDMVPLHDVDRSRKPAPILERGSRQPAKLCFFRTVTVVTRSWHRAMPTAILPTKPPTKPLGVPVGAINKRWWSQTGSNRRPHACKARALPTELWPLFGSRGRRPPMAAARVALASLRSEERGTITPAEPTRPAHGTATSASHHDRALVGAKRRKPDRAQRLKGAGPSARDTRWWAWEDSNFRPHAYQARALTN